MAVGEAGPGLKGHWSLDSVWPPPDAVRLWEQAAWDADRRQSAVLVFGVPVPGGTNGQALGAGTNLSLELLRDAASESTTLHTVGKIMRQQMARTLAIAVAEAHLKGKHKQPVWCCPLCPEGTEPFAALFGVEIGSVYLDNLRRSQLARTGKK